jgi:hypothetical protein
MKIIDFGTHADIRFSIDATDLVSTARSIRGDRMQGFKVLGSGQERKVFPDREIVLKGVLEISEEMIQDVLKEANKRAEEALRRELRKAKRQAKKAGKARKADPQSEPQDSQAPQTSPPTNRKANEAAVVPPFVTTTPLDSTLWVVAQGVLDELDNHQFDGLIAKRFNEVTGSYRAAREKIAEHKMDENLSEVIDSLDSHVVEMRELYAFVVPRALGAKIRQYPEIPAQILEEIISAATDRYFQNTYEVVSLYAKAFRQETDRLYPVLNGLRAFLHSCYTLFMQGDPTGTVQNNLPGVRTRVFKAGPRFLLYAGEDGPATISGGQELLKGPIGVHLGFEPLEELSILLFELPINGHENFHNIFWDIEGLPEETVVKVAERIQADDQAGKYSFTNKTVIIGGKEVPILPFLAMAFLQMIPEIAADLSGGVQYCGTAFWKAVLPLFIAFNSRKKGVLQTEEGLRVGSIFDVQPQPDGTAKLKVETHTQDFPRGLLIAETYEKIGFPQAADECRARTVQANATFPEYVSWTSKEFGTIEVLTSDFAQLFPSVIEAMLSAKMDSLGGQSNSDIVNWTPARELKVQLIRTYFQKLFIEGNAELPDIAGDVYPHYVGAALTHVYWDLVAKGYKPNVIFSRLSAPGLDLLLTLDEQAKAKAAEKAAKAAKTAGEHGKAGKK